MKHLYALITALGIEFSPVAYAREHQMPQQCWTSQHEACEADHTRDGEDDYWADYGRGDYDVGADYGDR